MNTATKNRIAFITRRYKLLESHLLTLDNALKEGRYNKTNLNLRIKRVTDLFYEYEHLHGELTELNENNELVRKFAWIQDTYYELASRVQGTPNPDEMIQQGMGNSTFLEKQKLLKLPIAELPKFDGSHDKWLSFKNTFVTMIDARVDIDDLVKFLYLRNALLGDALNKISIYDASAANYSRAWKLLVESYKKKRVFVSKHYDAILDVRPLSKANSGEISRLVDDARQHLNMLETLNVKIDEGMIIRILERALPIGIRNKWEETLALDELPDLAQFYKFINEAAFRLCAVERDNTRREETGGKRRTEQQTPTAKARRVGAGTRALVTSASTACVKCNGDHPLYKCPAFGALNTQQRWEFARRSKLCRNCLRVHDEACSSTHCKFCSKFHHSLLHTQRSSPRSVNETKPANSVDFKPTHTNTSDGNATQT